MKVMTMNDLMTINGAPRANDYNKESVKTSTHYINVGSKNLFF